MNLKRGECSSLTPTSRRRAKEETEYAAMLKEQELKQLERNEELVLDRLAREDDAARARAEMQMRKKLETAMKVEEARAER